MPLVSLDAVPLRSQDYSETSRIVTFLTREQGLVKAIAKGSRGARSRFGASLEPLQRLRITLSMRSSRDLQTLTQADLLHPFARLREDLFRSTYAQALAELLARLVPAEQPVEELFEVLLDYLLEMEEGLGDPQLLFLSAQLRVADLLGYGLRTDGCLRCDGSLAEGGTFVPARGGLFCRSCHPSRQGGFQVGGETVGLLKQLAGPEAAGAAAGSVPSRRARQESGVLLRRHLEYHTETVLDLRALRLAESLERYRGPDSSQKTEGSR